MTKQPHVDIDIMTEEKKLEFASKLVSEVSLDSIGEDDVFKIMSHHKFNTKISVEKAVRVMAYIRLRDFESYTRVDAFKKVYPERWTEADTDTAIGSRARRLETTDTYKMLIMELQLNFYAIFAVERVHVINESLKRAFDNNVSEKYNFEYMKLFLESTKQPEETKSTVDVNINSSGVSIKDVETQLAGIAEQLQGASGSDIMDAVLIGETDDN